MRRPQCFGPAFLSAVPQFPASCLNVPTPNPACSHTHSWLLHGAPTPRHYFTVEVYWWLMRSVIIWLESQRQHKPLTSESSGSPNPARNTYGHYAAFKLAANTGAQALQTTPPSISSFSRHPNVPSLVLAAFQSVPITTKHTTRRGEVYYTTCSSSQPSGRYVPSSYCRPNI
ncbi:hypothetical protein K503DRAFT_782874 [Rhizopogon vinicolor AM-OR11-026]|uniref:Uncharacterized protein n=1 Tax=Rhizopogon vinicolor AM-OR11-026 TaxID=1314800 RepID=A0A1B7N0Q9_9AGAM|nr:hypothetical protein K503DRAFT_782874 [Rhizopogon vinicolor AM-OR11-026]